MRSRLKALRRILLVLLLLAVVGAGLLIFWQKDNINALRSGLSSDPEQLEGEISDAVDNLRSLLDEHGVTIPIPDLQDSLSLIKGEMTQEELEDKLGIQDLLRRARGISDPGEDAQPAAEEPAETGWEDSGESEWTDPAWDPGAVVDPGGTEEGAQWGQPSGTDDSDGYTGEPVDTITDLKNQCVAELSSCQASFLVQLSGIRAGIQEEWSAKPVNERTSSTKRQMILSGMRKAYTLEAEADEQVQEILDKYRDKLTMAGGDAEFADQLWIAYCAEKESAKAYYLNLYT